MPEKVEGKTFVITGGASGLGAGFVEAFLKEGAKNVAIIDISDVGKALAEKLNKVYSGKVIFIKCDIGDEECCTQAFNEVVNKLQTVDVLINNAGIMNDSPNVWRKSIAVNLQGLISMTFKAIKHMDKEKGGKGGTIINIASIAAFFKSPELPVYGATKSAVLQFTHSIATSLTEKSGVRVMTMNFGATDTPLLHNLDTRVHYEKFAKDLEKNLAAYVAQPAEAAVKGVVDAFKQGAHKTIWVSLDGKPVKDITPLIDGVYDSIQESLFT